MDSGSFVPFLQPKIECRTSINGAFRPNAAAVPMDDPLNRRQSHPRSREVVRVMEALEGAEEPLGVGRVESSAVVSDEIGKVPVAMRLPKLNTSGFTLGGEFPGVPDQVFKCNSHKMGIR
jgi:hypothetical protein